MIAYIYFDLFSSPTKHYAGVSGECQVDPGCQEGDEVTVLATGEGGWFTGKLSILSLDRSGPQNCLRISLDDVVADGREEAARLAGRFEREAGLCCELYD